MHLAPTHFSLFWEVAPNQHQILTSLPIPTLGEYPVVDEEDSDDDDDDVDLPVAI